MITSQRLLYVYTVFAAIYSVLLLQGVDTLTWYLKPFLLPFLFYAVVKSDAFESKKWLLFALFFSWIGDCILMFADKGELYFIFGLVAFLAAHILLIVLFAKQKSDNKSFKKPLFWVGFVCATVYLAGILSILLPSLGDLSFPVTGYALTITIMLKMALKGTFDWKGNSKYLVLAGAVFFVASDSILAINKFHTPIASASYSIMITYLIAQFYITSGILELNQKK
ncbi:MAG: lysoplasmalogenase [Flavobacterium sp.]|uniref:lysoplasmalogenase n=1 Tax=Flavobacterium sp. TaxID=239 RepID=UPI003266EFA0